MGGGNKREKKGPLKVAELRHGGRGHRNPAFRQSYRVRYDTPAQQENEAPFKLCEVCTAYFYPPHPPLALAL